jgi:hypothetical protein
LLLFVTAVFSYIELWSKYREWTMEEFKALELCIYKEQDYHSVRKHIMKHGLYKRDSLGFPLHVSDDPSKSEAIGVLEKMFKVASEREEPLCDESNDRLREYWYQSRPGQYGLLSQPIDDWSNRKQLGYQMLQVLLIKQGLLTSDEMRELKANPGKHLPKNLCLKLHGMGVEGDPKTIRRYIMRAAETYYG